MADGDPQLSGPPAPVVCVPALEPVGFFEHGQRAIDLSGFLVAAVLFLDPLCGPPWRRPVMTGVHGPVVVLSGT